MVIITCINGWRGVIVFLDGNGLWPLLCVPVWSRIKMSGLTAASGRRRIWEIIRGWIKRADLKYYAGFCVIVASFLNYDSSDFGRRLLCFSDHFVLNCRGGRTVELHCKWHCDTCEWRNEINAWLKFSVTINVHYGDPEMHIIEGIQGFLRHFKPFPKPVQGVFLPSH